MLTISRKRKIYKLAQNFAPVDTRNLQINAIKGLKWSNPNKFKIKYDSTVASYVEPLNEGWTDKRTGTIHDKHKGFIEDTVLAIHSLIVNELILGKTTKVKNLKPDNDLFLLDRRIKVYKKSLAVASLMKEGK